MGKRIAVSVTVHYTCDGCLKSYGDREDTFNWSGDPHTLQDEVKDIVDKPIPSLLELHVIGDKLVCSQCRRLLDNLGLIPNEQSTSSQPSQSSPTPEDVRPRPEPRGE